MVDLKKLRSAGDRPVPLDPRRIFDRLPKPEGVNDLWESQGEVLRNWHDSRGKRDVVIKLNTGGGKTLVGLLIAQSLMNEHRVGALYLCANNQLVDQTLAKAHEFQFRAVAYETGYRPLPAEFANGEAIVVATYRALFHGYSKFGIRGQSVPVGTSAIICDDAHTAFADIRNAFTVVVGRKRHPTLYTEITSRFRDAAEAVNRLGTYDRRVGGQDLGVFEVPRHPGKKISSTP
jgi:superfamily II DNA or RNA helicase